jgi:hypothetical protein
MSLRIYATNTQKHPQQRTKTPPENNTLKQHSS